MTEFVPKVFPLASASTEIKSDLRCLLGLALIVALPVVANWSKISAFNQDDFVKKISCSASDLASTDGHKAGCSCGRCHTPPAIAQHFKPW
jgi:hypothetical protein